ncbi:MAG: hypothetical protein AB1657_00205 [Candidatus Micrarchaeota archaeon]
MASRFRAVATFDLLFCAIPIMLVLNNILIFSALAGERAEGDVGMLTKEGRLLAVSDYVVNYAAAEKEGEFGFGVRYRPNLIDAGELETGNWEQLGEQMGLENLNIGWGAEGENCIYRLVVYEEEIRKLYFCSG